MLTLLSLAAAAELHNCKATATGPSGHVLSARGYGASPAEAARAARQSTRFLADQHLLVDAGRAWYAGQNDALDGLATAAHTTGTKGFAVPGWTFEAGSCTTTEVVSGAAWSAKWNDEAPVVTRFHPADALEAARRRGCVAPYQIAFMQSLKAAKDGPVADRSKALTTWTSALSRLQTCWAAAAPDVTVAALPAAVEAPAQCTVIDHRGGRLAVGYGSSSERAAEDALRQSLLVRTRDLLGDLGHAADRVRAEKGDEAAQTAVVGILERIAGLTGASDPIDRARLACNTVTPGPLVWSPTENDAAACNSMSWTERPTTPVAMADAGSFLDTTCAMQVDPTFQIVRFSLPKEASPKRDRLIASAFMISGRCEATCLGHATWGTVGSAIVLHDAPDRRSKNAVIKELKALDSSPMAGMRVLPTLQDPDSLRGLFEGTLVPQLQKDVYKLPADRWKRLDGHWILTAE